jgi:hypothetical protein
MLASQANNERANGLKTRQQLLDTEFTEGVAAF